MAQFNCPICNEGFEQKSRLESHMMTSHPEQAPSAADMEAALKDADFPMSKDEIVAFASGKKRSMKLLEQLPDREYRDAAEVARALGEIKSKKEAPSHQPSKLGGKRAMESPSAAKIASLFEGVSFPASAEDLKDHARDKAKADESTLKIVERFRSKTYNDMSDVAKEIQAVT